MPEEPAVSAPNPGSRSSELRRRLRQDTDLHGVLFALLTIAAVKLRVVATVPW
ncbi:MAG: hypothetical protein NXI31_13205 [bacterium]|nr:hypothetical protein [bacterium]